jgi:hypothetical protein
LLLQLPLLHFLDNLLWSAWRSVSKHWACWRLWSLLLLWLLLLLLLLLSLGLLRGLLGFLGSCLLILGRVLTRIPCSSLSGTSDG